jgi:hypothetical protein
MSNATGGLRLIVFPTVTLFREFQGCGEFLLTIFEVFVMIKSMPVCDASVNK